MERSRIQDTTGGLFQSQGSGSVSVFIYVDGVMVERFLVGYMPFNWIIDPAKLSPGERVITGLVAWRDDHFGIAHVRVWVEGEQKTVKR